MPDLICPECRDGKHQNCVQADLSDSDEFVDCQCGCEPSRTCPNCGDVVPEGFTLDVHLNCNWPEDAEHAAIRAVRPQDAIESRGA